MMKSLTKTEQRIKDLWPNNTRIQIAKELNIGADYVTTMARGIRVKGYSLDKKNIKDDDTVAILDSVKRIQRYYNQAGDTEAFKHEYRRIYQAIGFDSINAYSNRVKSFMGKNRVEGCYSDYIRGKVPGHRYIGTMPAVLVSQLWNSGLVL